MKKLFWRFYLIVVGSLLLFGVVTFWLAKANIGRADNQLAAWQQSRIDDIALIVEQIVTTKPAPQWRSSLSRLSKDYRLPIVLVDQEKLVYASPGFFRDRGGRWQDNREDYREGHREEHQQNHWRNHQPDFSEQDDHEKGRPEDDHHQKSEQRWEADFPERSVASAHHAEDRARDLPTIINQAYRRGAQRRELAGGQKLWVMPLGPKPTDAPPWLIAATSRLGPLLLGMSGLILLMVYPLVRRLSKRFSDLEATMTRFGEGDLQVRADVPGADELASLGQRFNSMAAQLEQLVGSHKTLLATASHELRSPLARLKMASSLVAGQSPDNNHLTELTEEIDRNIREMDALIEEIMLTVRLDSQQFTPALSTVSLPVIIDELHSEFPETAVVWQDAIDDVHANATLLKRALRNLLENAHRYANQQVTMTIRVAEIPGKAEIVVADNGSGIPEAYREQIFEPFFRLPTHAEHEGGMGLGLYMVKQIADLHAGVRYEAFPEGAAEMAASRSAFIFAVQQVVSG